MLDQHGDERHRRDLEEEVRRWRGASMEERSLALHRVLHLASAIVRSSPRGPEMLRWQDPRSPEAVETWRRMVHRRGRP